MSRQKRYGEKSSIWSKRTFGQFGTESNGSVRRQNEQNKNVNVVPVDGWAGQTDLKLIMCGWNTLLDTSYCLMFRSTMPASNMPNRGGRHSIPAILPQVHESITSNTTAVSSEPGTMWLGKNMYITDHVINTHTAVVNMVSTGWILHIHAVDRVLKRARRQRGSPVNRAKWIIWYSGGGGEREGPKGVCVYVCV